MPALLVEPGWITLAIVLVLAGLWLNEQRRRRRAEGDAAELWTDILELKLREQIFQADRKELVAQINHLRANQAREVAIVYPPNYLGDADTIDIRA